MSELKNINAGIFAAGKGDRLKKDFPDIPKPLVSVCDKTLIEYAIENVLSLNPLNIGVLLNLESGYIIDNYLRKKNYNIKTVMLNSKTSFESFFTISNFLKEKGKTLVLSTVDSILNKEELKAMVETHTTKNSYITLGITECINDEKPLLVEINKNNNRIESIGKSGGYATNGIYCLSYEAINDIKPKDYRALREFLSQIDFNKKLVSFYNFNESFDIDDAMDVRLAEDKLRSKK
ncbi:MAG: hypothetical protein GX445_08195 [Elusimicrobia bacterium]|jgi:choline kinase|nr:hypothetical protein [Elusimicrobiota bacterium]